MTPPHLTRAINRFTAAAIRLQKVREKDALAKAARLDVERFFQAQYGMVMLRFWHMQEYFPQPEPEPVRLMEAKKSPDPAPAALKRWADIWHSIETETTPALQETIVGVERAALPKGADQLRNQLGLEISFRLANPRAVAWFMKHGGSVDYIRGIQQTTAESLNRVITTALDEGWSYTQTAREIQKLYDGPISRQRAQLIATNESAQAYEAGNRAFADTLVDDGVEMEKMWTTSHDDRVSDGCEENESDGWIPIHQPHSSGDQEPPRFPGCRCYEQYRQARA